MTKQVETRTAHRWRGLVTRTAAAALVLTTALGSAGPRIASADFADGRAGRGLIVGRDNDNTGNPVIQPAGTAANQSLNNTDIQLGTSGNDVLIGLLGGDVQAGGWGDDIYIGGPEGFQAPNSDVLFGDAGNDVSIWAPGDGSDFFHGGSGLDAQVFGLIDRDPNDSARPRLNGPADGYTQALPSVDTTGQPGFCTIERVPADSELGYEFLARFFVRATGNLAVTLRLVDVEQVFCTSQAGGQITYADLRQDAPQFEVVTLDQVHYLNHLVGRIIR